MQRLMAEERELFLDERSEDEGNGFYERAFLYFFETFRADLSMPGACLAISENIFFGGLG